MSKKLLDFFKWLLHILVILAVIFLAAHLILRFLIVNDEIFGPSMQPTFQPNDRVIAVRHAKIERGDIIIFKAPDEKNEYYIKRVIGIPNDTVSSDKDILYINHQAIPQPYLGANKAALPDGSLLTNNFSLSSLFNIARVPANSYFVLGDNRRVSKDSRMFGFVKKSTVEGVVKVRYWPITNWTFF